MKKVKKHVNRKLMVSAICISTLGAQLGSITNIKAATTNDNVPSVSESTGTPSSQQNNSTDSSKISSSPATLTAPSESTDVENSVDKDTNINTDTDKTIDADKITNSETDVDVSAPVIVNNPNSTEEQNRDFLSQYYQVHTTAQIAVTNENGTSYTQPNETKNAGSIILDDPNNTYEAYYTITNDQDKDASGSLLSLILPKYYEDEKSTTNIIVDKDKFDEATIIKNSGLPENTVFTYSFANKNVGISFKTKAQYGDDFDISQITGIQLPFSDVIPANGTYTISIPLTIENKDIYNKSGIATIGSSDYGFYNGYNSGFKIAEKELEIKGTYSGVTSIKLGELYQAVDPEIQALLPKVKDGDIKIYNNYRSDQNTQIPDTQGFSGSLIVVNLPNTGIAGIVKDKGYSMLLTKDGTPQVEYSYISSRPTGPITIPVQDGDDSLTPTDPENNFAPYIYMTMRKVIDAKDSTLKVGDNWNQTDNYVSGLKNDDSELLPTDEGFTTTVSDPNGIMKNGVATKSGIINVTYSYQVSDDYYGKSEPYIISKTVQVKVEAAGTSGGSGSSTTDNSSKEDNNNDKDSNVSENNNNEENNNSTDTGDQTNLEEPVISPNEPIDPPTETGNIDTTANFNDTNSATKQVIASGLVYSLKSNQSDYGRLSGYQPQTVKSNNLTATLPQTGSESDSTLKIMGTLILTFLAGFIGIDLKKKNKQIN